MFKQIILVNNLWARFKGEVGGGENGIEVVRVIALGLDMDGEICPLICSSGQKLINANQESDFVALDERNERDIKIIQILPAKNYRAYMRNAEGNYFFREVDLIGLYNDGFIAFLSTNKNGEFEDVTTMEGFVEMKEKDSE